MLVRTRIRESVPCWRTTRDPAIDRLGPSVGLARASDVVSEVLRCAECQPNAKCELDGSQTGVGADPRTHIFGNPSQSGALQ
jgi:hypothetical protein